MTQSDDPPPRDKLLKPSNRSQNLTLGNEYLQNAYKKLAFVAILIPFAGSVIAVELALRSGIRLMAVGLLVSMYALTTLGIEVGFHRLFSYHAFPNSAIVGLKKLEFAWNVKVPAASLLEAKRA